MLLIGLPLAIVGGTMMGIALPLGLSFWEAALLASILFALFVLEETNMPGADQILTVTLLTVTLSIIAHGILASPLARVYGAWTERLGACTETQKVSEMPTRV